MDPLGVIASTLAIIQAITGTYKAIQSIHGLPEEFKKVEIYLPVFEDTLKQAEEGFKNVGPDEASKRAIEPLLSDCQTKTEQLQKMLVHMEGRRGKAVIVYRHLLIQFGRENRVETLMLGILERMRLIADNQVMRGVTCNQDSQVAKLDAAIKALSNVESSVSDRDLDRAGIAPIQNNASNSTGYQFVNSGKGTTYNNNGGYNSGGGTMNFAPVTNNTTIHHDQDEHDETKQRKDKEQRNAILRSLSVHDYKAAKERNRDRVPGTCEWFAGHQCFQAWEKPDEPPRMLLVSADPGCGKSVLAKHLVDTVLPTTNTRTTCYFFFKDDFEDQKPARNALSCILHQLLLSREQVFSDEIVDRFETSSQSTSSLQYLWDTLVLAASSKHAGEVVCILDAFDECATDDQDPFSRILRHFYDKGPSNANLKFLVTSRPYDPILRGLQSLQSEKTSIIHLRGESEEEVAKISKEIDVFIDAEIGNVQRSLGLLPEERELLHQAIRHVTHRTYLWVHLTLDWINKEIGIRKTDIKDIASHLPQTVDDAYEKILSRIPDCYRSEAKKLLRIIVAAVRPLTLQEIDVAMAVERSHTSHSELRLREHRIDKYVRDICGLFVAIVNSKVYLLHQTARTFLLPDDKVTTTPDDRQHNSRAWKHSLQPQTSEGVLFQICAAFLLLSELNVAVLYEDVDKYVERYTFLEYASTNWALHHRSSSPQDTDTPHLLIYPASKGGTEASMADRLWFRVYWLKKDTPRLDCFTPLMAAAYFGLEGSVKLILKEGIQKIEYRSRPHDRTALSWASENGSTRIVRLLIPHPRIYRAKAAVFLSRDNTVTAKDWSGMTPLHYATLNGHGQIVNLLVKAGAKSNVSDSMGGTPLSYALISQHHGIFQKLQKRTSEEDVRSTLADLLSSAVRRDNKSVVRQVLALKIDHVTSNSSVLLSDARSAEVVHLLLDNGADVNVVNESGNTQLRRAALDNNTDVVQALLKRGADIHAVNKHGNTSLHIAAEYGSTAAVQLLLDHRADVTAINEYGNTPLHSAACNKNTDIVQALLNDGADVTAVNKRGSTPLHFAAIWENPGIVQLLLNHGGDVTAKNEDGNTPLHFAAWWEDTHIVTPLLNHGADVTAENNDGDTPLDLATRWRRTEVVKLLLNHGANMAAVDGAGSSSRV